MISYTVPSTVGSTYLWTIAGGIQVSGTNTNSIFVNWNSSGAGNVNVVETHSGGCVGTAVNLPVTITGPITTSISGNANVCPGSITAYSVTNTPGSTYTWFMGSGAQVSGGNTNSITVQWSGTAGPASVNVQETNASGCVGNFVSIPVSIGNPPASPIVGNSGVCANANGISYSVVNTAGSAYAWTITGGTQASGSNTNSITVNWGSGPTGTVQVVETNSGGCSSNAATKSISMTPVTSSITGNSVACTNSSGIPYSVMANSGSTYAWTISGGTQASGSNTNNITVNWGGGGTGTVSVVETFSGGCNGAAVNKTVTIGSPATSSITGINNTCTSANGVSYSVTNNTGSTYAWTIAGGTQASGTNTNSVTVNWGSVGTGNVSVVETFSGGCVGPVMNLATTINALPIVSAPSSTMCAGATMTLSPTSGGTWSNTRRLVSSDGTITAPFFPGSPSFQFIFTQASTGCSNMISITITAPLPISFTTGSTIVNANTNGVSYSVSNTAGSTYAWTVTGGTKASGGNTNSITVNWGSAGTGNVSVVETSSNGCTGQAASQPVSIINTCPPTSAITGSATVCANASGVAYGVTNNTGSTYAWTITGGTQASGGNTNNITVNWGAAGSGIINVVETFSGGCIGTAVSKTVTFGSLATTFLTGVSITCSNTNGVGYSVNNHTGSTYAWTITGGTQTSGTNTNSIAVNWGTAGSGSVSVTETFQGGCTGSAVSFPVTIKASPTNSTGPITGATTICSTSTGLVYSVANTAGSDYSWTTTDGGGFIKTGQGTSSVIIDWTGVGYSNAGNVRVTESISGCPGNPVNLPVTITRPSTSSISITGAPCINSASTFGVVNTANSTYAWTATGGNITGGAGTNSITVNWITTGAGSVSVVETNASGCVGFSKTFNNFQVYPAPQNPPVITGSSSVCINTSGSAYGIVGSDPNSLYQLVEIDGGSYGGGNSNGSSIMVNWSYTPRTGNLRVIEKAHYYDGGLGGCSGPVANFPVAITAPATGDIIGKYAVCNNSTVTYNVTNTSGSTYAWNVSGGTIVSGVGTSSISVAWGVAGLGNISVTETTASGCVGNTVSTNVVIGVPSTTSSISSTVSPDVCENTTNVPYWEPASGSTYAWSVTNGTIVSNSNNGVTINWGSAGNGSVQVTETNVSGCQNTPVTLPIVVHAIPAKPTIIGNSSTCVDGAGQIGQYNVSSITSGSSYVWGRTINGIAQPFSAIVLGSSPTPVSFNWNNPGLEIVSVYEASWGCASPVATLPVTVIATPVNSITGSNVVCPDTNGWPYSVTNTIGSTYEWTVLGGTQASGGMTNSINVNWGFNINRVNVTETNSTGCKGTATLMVSRSDVLTSSITGSNSVWVNSTGVNYSVVNSSGSTYAWTVTKGTQVSGGNSNSITVDWGASSGTGNIKVIETNSIGCVGLPANLPVALNITVPTISITSQNTGIYGGTIELTTNTGGSPGAVTYTVVNGTGTASVSGSILSLTSAGTVTVIATVAAAANYTTATSSQTITINKADPVVTITSVNSGTYLIEIPLSASTGGSTGTVTYSVTGITGAAVVLTGNHLFPSGAGTVSLSANVAADANYNAASSPPQIITINKANQTITFNTPPANLCRGNSVTVSGSSSGLPIVFSIDNTTIASISNSFNSATITSNSTGSIIITASQPGDSNYNPATSVVKSMSLIACANPISIGGVCSSIGGSMVNPTSVATYGNYAFVVSDPGITNSPVPDAMEVLDISGPSPVHVTTYTNGALYEPRSIAISGDGKFVYVACWHSHALFIIDVTIPTAPSFKGMWSGGSVNPDNVFVSGNFAYVISSQVERMDIIDITNPAAPVARGNITIPGARKCHVSGTRAYVICSGTFNGMKVIDVSTATAPVVIGSISDGAGGAILGGSTSISVVGNNAFITSAAGLALEVVDVTNSSAPSHKASVANGVNGAVLTSPNSISIQGNYAYITNYPYNNTQGSLEILDISNASFPTHVGSTSGGLLPNPTAVVASSGNNYAYVVNQYPVSSLATVNVSIKATPVPTGYYSKPGTVITDPKSISLANNFAYIVNGTGNSVQAIDLTNSESPITSGYVFDGLGGAKLKAPQSIAFYGNYAFVASTGSNAIEVLNIASPASISHSASIVDGSGGALLNAPTSVFVSGNYAYVTSSNALEVLNISTPTNPSHSGSITSGTGGALLGSARAVFVSGNYAYVVGGSNALEIINVSSPGSPSHVGSLSNGSNGALLLDPVSIYVVGRYAYIASNGSNALEIVDVFDPANPVHKGSLTNVPTNLRSITISGNYAYMSGNTLQIIDISNPVAPVQNAVYGNGGSSSIAVSGNYGYNVYPNCLQVLNLFPLYIDSFAPACGLVGTPVTITGANFSSVPANNTVRFNGMIATVTASTPTSITAIVPSGTTNGPISVVVAGRMATATLAFKLCPITSAITGTTAICAGTNGVAYSVVNTSGSTYAWTITGGTQASGGTMNSITVNWGSAGTGNVSVVETNSSGSVGAAVNESVTINANTVATSAITGRNIICAGTNGVKYSVINTVGSTYAWTITGGTQASGGNTSSITVNWGDGSAGGGLISVVETNSSGCINGTNTVVQSVRVAANSNGASIIASPGCYDNITPVTLSTNPVGTNYSWTAESLSVGTTPSISATTPNSGDTRYMVNYLVNGTGAFACYMLRSCSFARIGASHPEDANVEGPTMELDLPAVKELTAYPNPATTTITVAVPWKAKEATEVLLYDMFGKLVTTSVLKKNEWKIEISVINCAEGLYVVRVGNNDLINTVKVMVMHK
ncbi:hypothetical protein WSM22_42750 [Cytophagales bacterium WSM2-2]|nr:hypothetical protein WSM22_42750 [Cytophagales bacterium WSM2-2]